LNLYTQIVNLPIKQLNGRTIPTLLVNDKISLLTFAYIRNLQQQGLSQSTILKHITSISLLWEFYLSHDAANSFNDKTFLKDFIDLRIEGSLVNKELSIQWKPVQVKTVKIDILNISSFFDFLELNFQVDNLNKTEVSYYNDVKKSLNTGSYNKHSLLAHKRGHALYSRDKVIQRKDNTGTHINSEYKAFPHDYVDKLIEVSSLRDKLIFILLSYGGIRSSELLHIFLNDISYDEEKDTARIILSNPVESPMNWTKNGIKKSGLRKEFLQDKFNKIPRNQLSKNNPKFSGWKSMTEDDGKMHMSLVHWSNPTMGKLFYELHLLYMKERLNSPIDTPYYFITLSGKNYGQDFTLNALKFQFYSYAKKIGLDRQDSGINLHGLRHFYGYYCANILKLNKDTTQRMMHHRSVNSTEVYYQKTLETIQDELNTGYKEASKNLQRIKNA